MCIFFELFAPTAPLGGISLHHGLEVHAQIFPHPGTDAAYALQRRDLPRAVAQPVQLAAAVGKVRRTVLGRGSAAVETAEHILSALSGCGVAAALIELDGPEPPILDGSAQPWVELLAPQLVAARHEIASWQVVRDFEYRLGGGILWLEVSETALVDCSIDFSHPLIGRQRMRWDVGDREGYITEIAPARTFGFLEDADELWKAGLAKGAGLASVVVFDEKGVVGGELRFSDEPVRHKLLDAIGDLALLGAPLIGGVVRLERPSHALMVEGLREACASGALLRG